MSVSITAALAVMTRCDVRRRGDSLRCHHGGGRHPREARLAAAREGRAATPDELVNTRHTVLLWDRDRRLSITGHPDYEYGFLCDDCHAIARKAGL